MKGENLTVWMRGGVILISALLMGISSCDCPVPEGGPGGSHPYGDTFTDAEYEAWLKENAGQFEEETREASKEVSEYIKGSKGTTQQDVTEAMKGQIFILSLNALAEKNDSDVYKEDPQDPNSKILAVSGLKQGTSDQLDPTIETNIKAWQPGGIYISAANIEALRNDLGLGPNAAPGSLKDPLKKLINLLKDKNLLRIEPLIVTQEGGQFQRLLTTKFDETAQGKARVKESTLGTQLGLVRYKQIVANIIGIRGKEDQAPDGTYYTWWIGGSGGPNRVRDLLHQVYDLGFTLNYWLVGGTLRGPHSNPYLYSRGRIQTSANVLGYTASGGQGLFPKVVKNWRESQYKAYKKMVTLIGDFPGKSFAEHVRTSAIWGNKAFKNEMEWDRLDWKYFKEEAKAAAEGKGIDDHRAKGRDRLYLYAKAVQTKGIDIVALSQDKLHAITDDPWKSRQLISTLRDELGFGQDGVVMVGDRTALIRDQHPGSGWIDGSKYFGIGREMSTVIQLNAADVKESLEADADLFHLWRFPGKTITYGPYTNKVKLEPESIKDTIEATLNDASLADRLLESRTRILTMKERRGFRIEKP